MGCFDDIIGVEGCGDGTSKSGLWLNGKYGVPGVNVITAANAADSETQTGIILMQSCVKNAASQILFMASEQLSKYWQFGTVIRQYNYTNNGDAVNGEQSLNLTLIDNCKKYTSFFIDTLRFKSDVDKTGFTVTINRVDYVFDMVANTTYELSLNLSFNEDLSISINDTGIFTGTSFFTGIIQQRCDEELFWCQFQKELYHPIRFMAAHLYFKEITTSNRYNLTTNMGADVAKENEVYYYNKTIATLKGSIEKIKNFLANEDCCCLRCADVEYTYAKP